MMDLKTFVNQMLTPGTVPCTLFGMALGLIFAVLCLTLGVGPALLIALFCLIGAFIGGVKDKKKFPRIVRSSEMEGGIEVGVSTCFYKTASLEWNPPVMRICGYPEVINRILNKVM